MMKKMELVKGTERIESYMRRKYFRSMLISAFFLFFLPLLVCVVLFTLYQRQVYVEEMRSAQKAALTRAAQLVDEQLSSITRIPGLLNVSLSVQQFYQSEDDMLLHYEVASVLNSYCEANSLVADIHLYRHGSNLVHTRNQKLLLTPQSIAPCVDGKGYADVLTQEANLRRFSRHHFSMPYAADYHTITYTAPVYRRNQINTLLSTVMLDTAAMRASFDSILSVAGDMPLVVLLNKKNECLLEMGDIPEQTVDALLGIRENPKQWIALSGAKYNVLSVESGVADWTFYLLMPMDMMSIGVLPILEVLLFVVLLECAILYVFMHINYRPLHSTYEAVLALNRLSKDDESEEQSGATNELGDIEHTVYSLVHDLRSLNETMISQKPVLRQMFWLDVINGKFENETVLLKKAKELGVSLPRSDGFVLVVKPGNGELFGLDDQARMDKLLGDFFEHELLMSVNQSSSVFLCLSSDNVQCIQQQLSLFLEQMIDIQPIIGVGGVRHSYTQISHSYLEARTAVDLHNTLGSPLIMYDVVRPLFDGMWTGCKQAGFYARRLESCILREDNEAIHQCFNDLGVLIETASPPLIFCRRICFDLSVLVYSTQKKRQQNQTTRSNQTNLMDELFSMCSREDVEFFLRKLEKQILPQTMKACAPDIMQMIDYLHKNYSRADFSCSEAATYFGMQPSTFSRFFKQHTNELPINYLTMLRIEAAKKLLVETDVPLNDIVLRVGYYSASSFIKRFREAEKMTPMAYREAHKAQ